MDAMTMRTIQTTYKNRLGKDGKIDKDETMPPEILAAGRATGGLGPGKISTKPG